MSFVPMTNVRAGPRGPEQDGFSLLPSMHMQRKVVGNRVPIVIPRIPTAPKILNPAIAPNTMRKVRGKEAINTRRVSRAQPVPSTDAIFPREGKARHERRGLGYMIMDRPTDGPLMPIADSDLVFMNSKLGQPRG